MAKKDDNALAASDLPETVRRIRARTPARILGERPGLAFADSLSAYLAYQPRPSHTDANRNLISNIHSRGVDTVQASRRILNFAAQVMSAGTSGYQLHEAPPSLENS